MEQKTDRIQSDSLDRYLSISRAVAGQLDFQKVLQRIADEIREILPFDHMDIAIITSDRKGEHMAFEVGVETGWSEGDRSRPIAKSPICNLLLGKIPYILTSDAWEDPQFHFDGAFDAPIYEADLHSRIHVALHVHGVVHGSLNISSHAKNVYSQDDLEEAKRIADLISPYIYALKMGEQARQAALREGEAIGREQALRSGALRLTEGMEEERKRLGMELHDQTLADLSSIYRQVTQMTRRAGTESLELAKVGRSIARCTDELRRIIENAKPGILELFGLQQAIEAQLEKATAGAGRSIKTVLNDETGGILDHGSDTIRTAVFRIVQEALTNAVKHSQCGTISVSLYRDGDHVIVEVRNDGATPTDGWSDSKRGVDNMKVRAALIGADIALRHDADVTCISLHVPLAILQIPDDADPLSAESTAVKRAGS
ncbi:GAF domain-containing sensor histidine kinase [Hoeflea poritis]|uniref:Histidine kinase n=1 Tax=Hoeflea poritis TaxID=2993659 RepID=A0ABT4VPI1_9HYPH|nr:GAF domain-containing protein [Hoeflea poritis]MDA4846619.1 histidine kinase [Hoeflea poritis]